jgi:hypothetical protein
MTFSTIFYEKKEQPTLGGGIFVHSTLLLSSTVPSSSSRPHLLSGASHYMHFYLAILFRVKNIPSFFGTSITTTHTICHIITF